MDANSGALPPNLADILATLSRFAPPPTSTDTYGQQSTSVHPYETEDSSSQYDPSASNVIVQRQVQTPAGNNVIDPATITEWSAGLRCVSKIAAQNPHFANAIRNMIINQRKNEMDWYSKRQELKREQAQKGHGSTELTSIMKSIGALTDQHTHQHKTEEDKQAELDAFDAKIHRAQSQMATAMTAELKGLGVPFFGTKQSVILQQDAGLSATTNRIPGQITAGELRSLQSRMVSYLEDMYKE